MNEDRARELAIQILDEFEELLAAKGIKIHSGDGEGREGEACLFPRVFQGLNPLGRDSLDAMIRAGHMSVVPVPVV